MLAPGLVYAALTSGITSSLGMLLVPSIAHEMRIPVNSAQWMLTINLLVGAVATPIMGRLSDGPHRKRLFLTSLLIIFVGCVICATAQDFVFFQVGRALQGLAYGIFPMAIAIARNMIPREKLRSTMSSLAVTGAAGAGIGYPLTGVLAQFGGFRFAFIFGAVFMATAMLTIWRVVPKDRPSGHTRSPFDFLGAILLGGGLATLLLGVSEGPVWGWASLPTLGCFVVSALLLTSWVSTALRSRHPLVNISVLRDHDIALAHGTAIALGATMYMVLSVLSIIAQAPVVTGYGIALPLFWAGFVMVPFTTGSLIANRLVRIVPRDRISYVLPAGAATVMASAGLLAVAHDSLVWLLFGMFFNGLGIASTYAALPLLIARRVAAQEFGSAVSFNQVLRTVGGSIGSAVVAAVFAATTLGIGFPSEEGITRALLISAGGSALTMIILGVSLVRPRRAE